MNILEVGLIKGREEGKAEGEILKLLSQIRKKINKGCSPSDIADALEESEEFIHRILDLMQKYPEWTDEQLADFLK